MLSLTHFSKRCFQQCCLQVPHEAIAFNFIPNRGKKVYMETAAAKWRRENGLPRNPTQYGVLTDLPDYSFLDGRPTPLCNSQERRLQYNKYLAEDVMKKLSEIDRSKQFHQSQKQQEWKPTLRAKGKRIRRKDINL